jgi:2-octaprenyl-6-methoxyphenol hydroxylase
MPPPCQPASPATPLRLFTVVTHAYTLSMPSTTPDPDILIAGGSYAGLTLALALAHLTRGDLTIAVVSPDFPALDPVTSDIRASALSRGSLHLLDHLGLWPALAPYAQPVTSIELTDSALDDAVRPTRLTYDLAINPSNAAVDLPRMVIVENHHLGRVLHDAATLAPGVSLITDAEIKSFSINSGRVSATLSSGKLMSACLLVAADGSRSRLRDLAGIGMTGHAYAQVGIITIVKPERPHGGRAIQHFLPAGPFALLPLTCDRICVTWTEGTAEAQRILAMDHQSFRAEVERRFGQAFGALELISAPKSWPLSLGLARNLIAPRFALVGDAAHTVHPLAGQGLNLGFRDIAALSETIVDAARLGLDIGQVNTLERYERWRRFDNLAAASGFDVLNSLFSTSSTLARSTRGTALALTNALPGFKSWLVDEASGDSGDVPGLLRARA